MRTGKRVRVDVRPLLRRQLVAPTSRWQLLRAFVGGLGRRLTEWSERDASLCGETFVGRIQQEWQSARPVMTAPVEERE